MSPTPRIGPEPAAIARESKGPDASSDLLAEVLRGLSRPSKELPCKLFYDEEGSRLFDEICNLPEYYLTRCETAIMRAHVADMAERIGPGCLLVEPGAGSSLKTRILLDHLESPAAYLPVDISREHLLRSADALRASYPHLEVLPICADFTGAFVLPRAPGSGERVVVYFPGSTIGNFTPVEARPFLAGLARLAGPRGGLLVGADLQKPAGVLVPAYDDARGVTAEFNLNILRRINRDLGGSFDLSSFRHRALYDEVHGRIEMHLVSTRDQVAHVGPRAFRFAEGEPVRTEYSHKYTLAGFRDLAASAGLRVERVWTDPKRWFSVQWMTPLPA